MRNKNSLWAEAASGKIGAEAAIEPSNRFVCFWNSWMTKRCKAGRNQEEELAADLLRQSNCALLKPIKPFTPLNWAKLGARGVKHKGPYV